VVFEASSQISEGRSVNYQQNDITHMPTDIWSYRNTAARHFEITGKLVSRTPSEAMANAYYVDVIRSWALPDFGNSGATPPILSLSAFYNKNINKVPCVLKSYGITYPDDVDWIYINTDGSQLNDPMPVICIIQVSLDEAYSPSQITNMDWQMTMLTAKDVASKAPPFFVYGQPGYYDGGAQPTIGNGYSDTGGNFAGLGTLTKSQINALANSGTSTAAIAAQQVVLANAQANATNTINATVQPNGFNPNAIQIIQPTVL
jgi:hypothetical protein